VTAHQHHLLMTIKIGDVDHELMTVVNYRYFPPSGPGAEPEIFVDAATIMGPYVGDAELYHPCPSWLLGFLASSTGVYRELANAFREEPEDVESIALHPRRNEVVPLGHGFGLMSFEPAPA
jgi:hypothetical protein